MDQAVVACVMLIALTGAAHAALYERTRGRSGPVAGGAFVLFGPVFGVLVVVGELANQQRKGGYENGSWQSHRVDSEGAIFGMEAAEYIAAVLAVGLIASLIAGLVYSQLIADEIDALRDDRHSDRPRPVVAPSLHALGLNHRATLSQVEAAFHALAKMTHPDAGGDAASFKRLQRNYEIAKRYVLRRDEIRAEMAQA
jgi:hypothetical protein